MNNVTFNHSARVLSSATLETSPDSILTALAQLAALQTGTDRSLISLFDQTHQYVIAEATTTLPIVASLGQSVHGETLWQCGTAIPRSHGVCEFVLFPADLEQFDQPLDPDELPMLVVDDLTASPRFSSKPYCQPGSGARFYAAVPIRTRRGINIGVLNVFGSAAGAPWSDKHSAVMRNLSRTIMDHLDTTRLRSVQRRSERMNRGLGCFIEGRSTLSSWESGPLDGSFKDDPTQEGSLNSIQQRLKDEKGPASATPDDVARESSNAIAGDNKAELPLRTKPAPPSPTGTNRSHDAKLPEAVPEDPNTVKGAFSKAANLIRESIEIEGCLFLEPGRSYLSSTSVPRAKEAESGAAGTRKPSSSSSSASSDDEKLAPTADNWAPSRVLGFSTTDRSSFDGARPSSLHSSLAQGFLGKLLRRYPNGHIFNFDANGELQSSDSASDDDLRPGAFDAKKSQGEDATAKKRKMKPWARRNEGNIILESFPGSRSVAFVPIWDPRREKWGAAGFAYTCTPTRVFSYHDDLNFLKAFGILVAGETLRLETTRADKAKSDALGSVSHELRSPLHGIVLGLELLNDTSLDVLQGNIAHTIETCCRTLTDTVDHLLDYSKINKFMTRKKKNRKDSYGRARGVEGGRSIEAGIRDLYKPTQLDALVEEVVESVFAGFNFQHLSIAQLSKQTPNGRGYRDVAAMHRLDSMKAMEDLGPALTKNGQIQLTFGQVSVFLVIDPACSWLFYTEPGAIRRIVMNIFGNALKYTSRGTILVSVDQSLPKNSRNKDRTVNFTVTDTGRGISEAYLQSDVFTPFSQEDHLAPGTGLGLSFVKQITSQLHGQISIKSKVGSGTTVRVSLPLSPVEASPTIPPTMADSELEFPAQAGELRGLRVQVVGFNKKHNVEGVLSTDTLTPDAGGNLLVQHVCRDWLHMQVVTDSEAKELLPDLVIRSEDTLTSSSGSETLIAKSPCVVVCANAPSAYQHTASYEGRPGTFEFTSQPLVYPLPL